MLAGHGTAGPGGLRTADLPVNISQRVRKRRPRRLLSLHRAKSLPADRNLPVNPRTSGARGAAVPVSWPHARRGVPRARQVNGIGPLTVFDCRPPIAPTTLATSESNRALPPYQGGPFDRLGRGQRITEVPTPSACAPFRVQAGACRPAGLRSIARNEEVPTPTAFTASRFRGGARHPAGSRSGTAPRPGVNRQGMEEDGRLERHCSHSRPVSGRGQPPDWFIFRGERVTRTPRR